MSQLCFHKAPSFCLEQHVQMCKARPVVAAGNTDAFLCFCSREGASASRWLFQSDFMSLDGFVFQRGVILFFTVVSVISAAPLDESFAPLNSTWLLSSEYSYQVLYKPLENRFAKLYAGFISFCNKNLCEQPHRYYFSVFLRYELDDIQVIWTANRKIPVSYGARLKLTEDGDLVLYAEEGTPVWSTGTSKLGVVNMTLEASGNLVLTNAKGDYIWQSFTHPTDCMVAEQILEPGQKLVASLSKDDYREGYFTLEVQEFALVLSAQAPIVPQVYGVWKTTTKIRELRIENHCILKLYSNLGTVLWSSPKFCTTYFDSRLQVLRMRADGDLRVDNNVEKTSVSLNTLLFNLNDIPLGACGKAGIFTAGNCTCGISYDRKLDGQSCPSLVAPLCHDNQFTYNASNYRMASAGKNYDYLPLEFLEGIPELSQEQCKDSCLQACDCKAAFYQRHDNSSTCFQVTEVYTLTRTTTIKSTTTYFKVRAPDLQSPGKRRHGFKVHIILLSVFVALLAFTIGLAVLLALHWKRKIRSKQEAKALSSAAELPRPFTPHELETATAHFSKKIGSGGFGSVFEGVLPDGSRIAVKRLDKSRQTQLHFESEVIAIGSMHHKNLVRLRGFCSPNLLVYEYLPNGSLDKWLFSQHRQFNLEKKLAIALDVARGLAYLHEGCRTPVLHLDVKPQNILLDENLSAKLADFGLSRIFKQGGPSTTIDNMISGTPGYMAPELLQLQVSEKLDIYSFGVVVLELATGQRAVLPCRPSSKFLVEWVFHKTRNGQFSDVIDKASVLEADDPNSNRSQMEKLTRIGMWCVQPDPKKRPSIGTVVKMLDGALEVSDPPIPPVISRKCRS